MKHGLTEDACLCASRYCQRAVGLRGEQGKPGRKPGQLTAEICKPAEAGKRRRPSIIEKVYQVKGARCAFASHTHRTAFTHLPSRAQASLRGL